MSYVSGTDPLITGNSRPFRARWDSRCGSCHEHIRVDDFVRYENHVLVHDDCGDVYVAPERPVTVCPRCFLTRPCEHDDDS